MSIGGDCCNTWHMELASHEKIIIWDLIKYIVLLIIFHKIEGYSHERF
jgi:hypothetical protein